MKLFLLRHGIAEDARPGGGDEERALTSEGVKKMLKASAGMKEVIEGLDAIYSSPYRRARQTAEIVSEKFGFVSITETAALLPGSRADDVIDYLSKMNIYESVMLVGHEPLLGYLASSFIGSTSSVIEFKKGSLCRIDFSGPPAKGTGTLCWLLTSKQLRSVGK